MPYKFGTKEWDEAYAKKVKERKESESKPYIMGTPEWVSEYEWAIKENAEYKELAKGWEGSIVLHILAKPDIGIEQDLYIFMDLWHGDCRSARIVPKEEGEKGDYVLTGSFDQWKAVARKEFDVVKGMVQGKIKLKGNLLTIMRYIKAATKLVDIVTTVPTRFPDELSADEVDKLKAGIKALRTEFST